MQNPILQMLNGNQQSNIMMQAVGAMMRGESPQSFLQNLAKNNPALQGLDLNNPSLAAEQLYKDRGQNINEAKTSIMEKVSAFMKK